MEFLQEKKLYSTAKTHNLLEETKKYINTSFQKLLKKLNQAVNSLDRLSGVQLEHWWLYKFQSINSF